MSPLAPAGCNHEGEVEYQRAFRAAKLANVRDVAVLLPKSYRTAAGKRYPVLYMHDGQNCLDPSTSFLGVDWQVDETVAALNERGTLQETIVVAVSNTSGRMREYADTPAGHDYMDFLAHDLKPFIDGKYRTLTDRDNTAVMGSSMGGLISFLCLIYHPEVFGKADCLSTTLSIGADLLFQKAEALKPASARARLYFDAGDELKNERYPSAFQRLESILTKNGFRKGDTLDFRVFQGQDHSERSWAKRVNIPLTFLFPAGK